MKLRYRTGLFLAAAMVLAAMLPANVWATPPGESIEIQNEALDYTAGAYVKEKDGKLRVYANPRVTRLYTGSGGGAELYGVEPGVTAAQGAYTLATWEELASRYVPTEETALRLAYAGTLSTGMDSTGRAAYVRRLAMEHIGYAAAGKADQSIYSRMLKTLDTAKYKKKLSKAEVKETTQLVSDIKGFLGRVDAAVAGHTPNAMEVENKAATDFVYNQATGCYESQPYRVTVSGPVKEAWSVHCSNAAAQIITGEDGAFTVSIPRANYAENSEVTITVRAVFEHTSIYFYTGPAGLQKAAYCALEQQVLEETITLRSTAQTLRAEKTLDGAAPADGAFRFTLEDSGGALLQTKSTISGVATFEPLNFSTAGIHWFTIKEAAGDDGGITRDETAYTVEVKVVEDEAGALAITSVAYKKEGVLVEGALFDSKTKVSVPVEACKTVDGAAYTGTDHTFLLSSADGAVVQEVSRVSGGSVAFTPLAFGSAGTYEYTISHGSLAYTVKIVIGESGGRLELVNTFYLSPDGAIVNGVPTFEGTAVPPASDQPDTESGAAPGPQPGALQGGFLWLLALLPSLAAVVAFAVAKKLHRLTGQLR